MLFENNTTTHEAIYEIPEPEFTETWRPILHSNCDRIINNTCDRLGLKVSKRVYSASKHGENVCCMVILGNGDVRPALFWRNSINKTFSFSLALGTFTTMCSNGMIFGGEVQFQEFRKHTKRLDELQLANIVYNGIEKTINKLQDIQQWHLSMKEIRLKPWQTEALSYEGILEGIISKLRIPEFNSLLFEEEAEYNPYTLFGFHGACLQLYRDMRMGSRYFEMQKKLHNFVTNRFGKELYQIPKN